METSAGFILFRDGKFLFLVHREGHLDFPKGHVEKGESLLEAALRETEEETGLGREMIRPIEGFRCVMEYEYSPGRAKRVVLFLAKVLSDNVSVSKEHRGYKWVPFGEAAERMKYDEQKKCIEHATRFLGEMKHI